MKKDVRTSVALCLLAATVTATAQNVPPEQTVPAPQQSAPPTPSPPPAPAQTPTAPPPQAQQPATQAPQSPPPPRYQYNPAPQSPAPQQYRYQYAPAPAVAPVPQAAPTPQTTPPPAAPPARPVWVYSESKYPEPKTLFEYHPFRFHIDGGGTLTERSNETLLDNGWNAGAGLSWYPTSQLPLGIRIDGTYNEFNARPTLLNQAAASYGTRVDSGTEKLWGGDVDLELDLLTVSPNVRAYLLAGGGWYKQQFTYRQTNIYPGFICFWWGCGPGYYGVNSLVARNTTDWQFAKNAGLGLEFAMGPRTSFFVEARYMRLNPKNGSSDFLPIRAGLRF